MSLFNKDDERFQEYFERSRRAWTPEKEAALQAQMVRDGIKPAPVRQ